MHKAFLDWLRREFPESDELSSERVLFGPSLFFNGNNHERLIELTDIQLFAILLLAKSKVRKIGDLKLCFDEKKILSQRLI